MARQRGSLELPGNIEPQSNQPLDATRRVDTKADLTNAANFPFKWEGMDVFVKEEKQWYYLKELPLTGINNWEKIGAGSGVVVDDELSETSTNPVQNKVITLELDQLSTSLVGAKERVDQIELDVEQLTASMVGVKTRLDTAEEDIDDLAGKFFVATYNVTTSQELLAYLVSTNEPFAPIVVKRGNDYYTSILSAPSGDGALVRVIGSGSGDFHIFTYTVTDAVWANSGYTLQKKLVSGTDIKTINSESLLGAGDIELPTNEDIEQIELEISALSTSMVGVKGRVDQIELDVSQLQASMLGVQNDLANVYTKTETDAKIDEKLANFDKLDYKVADSPPTATKVVIDGVEVDVVEGTRYLVKDTTEDRFDEYVVLDGTVYYLGPAAGSGVAVTETAITVSNPIGRYAMGEVIPAGTPLEEIDRKLLQKVSVPTLTDPSASLTFTAPTLAKVGTTVSGGNATVTLNRGSINPAYGTSGYRSGEATGYEITMTGAASSYSDSNDTGAFTVPDITRATPGKVTITGTASYAAGEQPKDSDGANYGAPLGAGSKSASKEIEFIAPFYYGATATLPRTDLTGLIEDLSKKGAKTYTVATDSEYVTFAYDASYGNLRSIKDEGDQENIDGYTKTQITVDGIAYNVYISQFLTVDPAAVYKLSF